MGEYIPGTHIFWAEYRCPHCSKLPPDFYIDTDGEEISIVYRMLFSCFEQIREGYGKPILVSSGYRCPEYQLFIFLRKMWDKYEELSPGQENIHKIIANQRLSYVSTHIFGLALDLLPPKEDLSKVLRAAKKAKPRLRIGHDAYQQNTYPHIHIDLGYKIKPRYSIKLRESARW